MKNSQIRQYKYFKVLVQEFHIKVDLGFVNAIVELFAQEEKSDEDEVSWHEMRFLQYFIMLNATRIMVVTSREHPEQNLYTGYGSIVSIFWKINEIPCMNQIIFVSFIM